MIAGLGGAILWPAVIAAFVGVGSRTTVAGLPSAVVPSERLNSSCFGPAGELEVKHGDEYARVAACSAAGVDRTPWAAGYSGTGVGLG
jgi:hypothetical protein